MKTIQLALLTAIAAAPIAFFVACGGDDSSPGKPVNKPDAAQQDTSPPNTDSGVEAGGPDSSPNTCATGITFDNKGSISSWPNLPQP